MSFSVPASLEAELDELTTHYPVQRSASLMFLHALQEHFGYISKDSVEWTARKLGLQPINVYELVTFYPMFRQEPLTKTTGAVPQLARHSTNSTVNWPSGVVCAA